MSARTSPRPLCLLVSYFGHPYRGSQYQPPPHKTVHGVILNALRSCLQSADTDSISLKLACRTDAGVHAVKNAFQFYPPDKCDLSDLHRKLNHYLRQESVRVTSIRRAVEGFDCSRDVLEKTYTFKIALHDYQKDNQLYRESLDAFGRNLVSHKTKSVDGFDEDKFMAAAEILDGVNDFSLFRSAVNLRLRDWDQHIIRRVIRSCRIHVRKENSHYCTMIHGAHSGNIELFNVTVAGRGFMHKQIRYMVGAMADVGNGRLKIERLREMLEHPERGLNSHEINVMSPHGLYLTELRYPDTCWV